MRLCISSPVRSFALSSRNPHLYACPTPPRRHVCVSSIALDSFVHVRKAAAIVVGTGLLMAAPAWADLNKFEAAVGGEFGNGTALQYGEATIVGKDFHGEVSGQELAASAVALPDALMSGSSLASCTVFVSACLSRSWLVDYDWKWDRRTFGEAISHLLIAEDATSRTRISRVHTSSKLLYPMLTLR